VTLKEEVFRREEAFAWLLCIEFFMLAQKKNFRTLCGRDEVH
jgi:hypothetical protein